MQNSMKQTLSCHKKLFFCCVFAILCLICNNSFTLIACCKDTVLLSFGACAAQINSQCAIQTVQKVVFFYVKPYCAALERRGDFCSKSYLGAWSRKMPLFQKQSAGLFLKFTPKRAGACLRRAGLCPCTPQAF